MTTPAPLVDFDTGLPVAVDQILFNPVHDVESRDSVAVTEAMMVVEPRIELVVNNPPASDITIPAAVLDAIIKAVDQLRKGR
jgi:hypothetical protein